MGEIDSFEHRGAIVADSQGREAGARYPARMRTSLAGVLSALAFLASQLLTIPAESLTWQRALALIACVGSLAALGIFARDQAVSVAERAPPLPPPANDVPPVVKP